MGRKATYKLEPTPGEAYTAAAKKFRQEDMSVKEFAAYLAGENGEHGFDRKSVRNGIHKICEEAHGRIKEKDFMRGGKFVLAPRYHEVLATLLYSSSFDARRNNFKISSRETRNDSLLTSIKMFLKEDLGVLQKYPQYVSVQLEKELAGRIANDIAFILQGVFQSDPVIRYKLMYDLWEVLEAIMPNVYVPIAEIKYLRLVAGLKGALMNSNVAIGLSENKELENLLVYFLQMKINPVGNSEKKCQMTDEEIINLSKEKLSKPENYANYIYQNLYQPNEQVTKNISESLRNESSRREKSINIKQRIQMVLDLDNPEEKGLNGILSKVIDGYYGLYTEQFDEHIKTIIQDYMAEGDPWKKFEKYQNHENQMLHKREEKLKNRSKDVEVIDALIQQLQKIQQMYNGQAGNSK